MGLNGDLYGKIHHAIKFGKSTILTILAISNSYFGITRGYPIQFQPWVAKFQWWFGWRSVTVHSKLNNRGFQQSMAWPVSNPNPAPAAVGRPEEDILHLALEFVFATNMQQVCRESLQLRLEHEMCLTRPKKCINQRSGWSRLTLHTVWQFLNTCHFRAVNTAQTPLKLGI